MVIATKEERGRPLFPMVANLVLDGQSRAPDLDLAFFRLDRFTSGVPRDPAVYRFSCPRFARAG